MTDIHFSILRYLADHPNTRKRSIAFALHTWTGYLVKPICELEAAGYIKYTTHTDPAQMEYYDTYELTEQGVQALL